MLKLGIIGYGERIKVILKLLEESGKSTLCAITDINLEKTKLALENENRSGIALYDDAEKMLNEQKLDGVLIGTNCSSHTHYALLCSKYNVPMFLEKPVCTNYEDLERLKSILHMNDRTVVSFPLRLTNLCQKVKEIIDSGKIGEVAHVQAYNNVPYARIYFHDWYRDDSETGGLFLQKATHDLDYITYLLGGLKPIRLCAMNSKQVFKGDMPAKLKCADCEKADVCTESPQNIQKNGGTVYGEYCCFASDTGNEDSGSVILEYENGMHAVYSQNFITRFGAEKRGARLIGYKGTVEFDWYQDKIWVYRHLEDVREEYSVAQCGTHSGGDTYLAENFIAVMEGKDKSRSTLEEGILSATMCLAAKRSANEHIFCEI
ncbi:MAG: Gfo/Idh/MocA family oxidoreductase [Acutalibacteraceae bacterium]|nr:Gfo/Idh/MocA family oxidoreductase [Acutalibacteraceae bacterium]